ncbi:uncharacterized protein ACOB8E_023905 isoform 2-T3 [Sarcophilus harrisii]
MEVKDLIITCENKMQTELDPIYPQLVKRCSLLSSLDLPGEMPLDLLKQEKAQISPRNSSRHFSAQNDIDYAQLGRLKNHEAAIHNVPSINAVLSSTEGKEILELSEDP